MSRLETLYFAGGCFWGTEHFFKQIHGVVAVRAGYANSVVPDPDYRSVCSGVTEAAETVEVKYDSAIISTEKLVGLFFLTIDPTSVNRQGNDTGTQYRTGIYYTDTRQEPLLRGMLDGLAASIGRPVAVELGEIKNFYPAEEYHQDYLDKNPGGYCHIDKALFEIARRANSPAVTQSYNTTGTPSVSLSPLQKAVMFGNATEPPFDNAYCSEHRPGIYVDPVSGEPLFLSTDKFDSRCGWPAFTRPVREDAIEYRPDRSHGMDRIEVRGRGADTPRPCIRRRAERQRRPTLLHKQCRLAVRPGRRDGSTRVRRAASPAHRLTNGSRRQGLPQLPNIRIFATTFDKKPYFMTNGFFRVAAASPAVKVADVAHNVSEIKQLINEAGKAGSDAVVFPEMCVTAYTCADLFHNSTLLAGALKGLSDIVAHTRSCPGMLVVVGMPLHSGAALYNCAVAICDGHVKAVVPKTYIPNYNEFYELRWWSPCPSDSIPSEIRVEGEPAPVPFGANLIIEHKDTRLGIEICEDLWTPVPPSCGLSMAGAEIILNLSASDDLIGKYNYLLSLVRQQSARCICGYAYASAGFGESSTDLVFDAKLLIAENGSMLGANPRWVHGNQLIVRDIDIEAIRRDRLHLGSFHDCAVRNRATGRTVSSAATSGVAAEDLLRHIDPHPFVPASDERLRERCEEIFNIQVAGLCQRLSATGCKCLVIGISGGLDSTLALLVAVRAFDKLDIDRKGIVGVTMPGFGTTGRTHGNAVALMEALGVSMREISIVNAVEGHFRDIDHDTNVQDVTYENCQARERTQILMDLSNQLGGMVLGTGDLSELALGWATYNGDHMSMYGVNTGVPKTLVKHLVHYVATDTESEAIRRPLLDIVDTPISPELIPAAKDGTIKQKTEDLVGPYELHDFFLYYTLRYGFSPKRIYLLSINAFRDAYEPATIKHWMRTFFRRFFAQQFKRSCLPDGPKVGSVCLSPRGDWRMPSDASPALWLKEVDSL